MPTDLEVMPTVEHEMDVQGSMPIKQRYCRFAPPMQAEIKVELQILLRQGIIEPGHPHSSSSEKRTANYAFV